MNMRQALIATILCSLAVVYVSASTVLAQTATATVTVNANLRSGPGTDFAKIGSVNANGHVTIVGCTEAGDWCQLTGGSWIFSELLENVPAGLPVVDPNNMTSEPQAGSIAATPTPTSAGNAMAAGNANLRIGPGTNYRQVGSVRQGETLNIVGMTDTGDWYKLDSGAWIAAFLVENAPESVKVVFGSLATTQNLRPTGTPTPSFFIIDVTKMIGLTIDEAEEILGPPALVTEMDPGDLLSIPYGGEVRDYAVNGTAVGMEYDNSGVLRGMVVGGASFVAGSKYLDWYEIKSNRWQKLFAAIGLPTNVSPTKTGYHTEWRNVSGFYVSIDSHFDSDIIWMIQVRRAD